MGGRGSGGAGKVDAETHRRRGTFRPGRHLAPVASGGGPVQDDWWLRGLSSEARLQGVWCLQHFRFEPEHRRALRDYLRVYGVEQRQERRHIRESHRVTARLWTLTQRLPWEQR